MLCLGHMPAFCGKLMETKFLVKMSEVCIYSLHSRACLRPRQTTASDISVLYEMVLKDAYQAGMCLCVTDVNVFTAPQNRKPCCTIGSLETRKRLCGVLPEATTIISFILEF